MTGNSRDREGEEGQEKNLSEWAGQVHVEKGRQPNLVKKHQGMYQKKKYDHQQLPAWHIMN